jgi:hypothetical protein
MRIVPFISQFIRMNDQMTHNSFKQTKSQQEMNKTFLSVLQNSLAIMLHLSFIATVLLRKTYHTGPIPEPPLLCRGKKASRLQH